MPQAIGTLSLGAEPNGPIREVTSMPAHLESDAPVDPGRTYARRVTNVAVLRVGAPELFDYLDGHARLAGQMSRRSWRMGWGRMQLTMDALQGRAVGSQLVLKGCVFGMQLSVEEVVIERTPPRRKVWETVGEPRLPIIGSSLMKFELTPSGSGPGLISLTIFFEYDVPPRGPARLPGRAFGAMYARWCKKQMVTNAWRAFA